MSESPLPKSQAPEALSELIGESTDVSDLRAQVRHLLGRQGSDRPLPTILLQGETGTGKGLLARTLHQASIRATRPFVDVDCAAIPETLLESELFGVERGAFTDARKTRPGLFQVATGGTIFLDEVGLLPRSLQAKLLKVVEERGVRRLGSTRIDVVDVWLLTATNIDLAAAVRDGTFREDLYHRLSAVTLVLPPLRTRNGDIQLLAEHFLAKACAEFQLPAKRLAPEALAAMSAYRWPGNVRELRNRLERVVLLSGEASEIPVDLLALPDVEVRKQTTSPRKRPHFRSLVEDFERKRLTEALGESGGNITLAASRLGLPRNTLRYRLAKLGVGPQGHAAVNGAEAEPAAKSTSSPQTRLLEKPTTPDPAGDGPRRLIAFLGVGVPEGRDDEPSNCEQILNTIVRKVQNLGGRIEGIRGSTLVSTFGVYPCRDAIDRAARAAVALSLASEGREDSPGSFVRFAVHACKASVRQTNHSFALDDALRRQEEAVLSAVLSASKPGTVIVSQAAARFLRGRVQLKAFAAGGDVESAFQLETTQRAPDRLGRASSIPFVGRRQELDLLEGIFERVRAGRGQVVGVVGESGMGKSRLVQEFVHRLTGSQQTHRWFRVVPYGPRLADLTIAEVLRQAWQIAHDDSTETIVMKVRSGLDRLGMSAELWAPPILTVFGIRGQRGIDGASPEELKKRLFDTLRRVALEMSKQQPLVIEVADLNLFGRTSLEFVSYFVEDLPGSRILLLTTYGPQYRPPWVAKSYVTQMALPPLGREESLALLHSVLVPGEGSARFVEPILERAEGNPFFLEEFARNVSAHDARIELPVPPSVRALVEARMDHLEDKARDFLYQAAAIGRRMPAERLKQICEEPALSDSIAAWKRRELIHEDIEDGEKVYVFRDALVWEVARHAEVGRPLGPF